MHARINFQIPYPGTRPVSVVAANIMAALVPTSTPKAAKVSAKVAKSTPKSGVSTNTMAVVPVA